MAGVVRHLHVRNKPCFFGCSFIELKGAQAEHLGLSSGESA